MAAGRQSNLAGLGSSGQFVGFDVDGSVIAIDNPLYLVACNANLTGNGMAGYSLSVDNVSATPEEVIGEYNKGRLPVMIADLGAYEMLIPLSYVDEYEVVFDTTYRGETYYVTGAITAGDWRGHVISIDATPSLNSDNLVTSGGVYSYVDSAIQSAIGDALGGSY